MTFKEFRELYRENPKIEYIKILDNCNKIIYGRVYDIDKLYERLNIKENDWYDCEPYWVIYFHNKINTYIEIEEDEILEIELSNKEEFNEKPLPVY